MSTVLKATFYLQSGEEKVITFSSLDPEKTDPEIVRALQAMVASGALGEGADAATAVKTAQKIATTVTNVSLA